MIPLEILNRTCLLRGHPNTLNDQVDQEFYRQRSPAEPAGVGDPNDDFGRRTRNRDALRHDQRDERPPGRQKEQQRDSDGDAEVASRTESDSGPGCCSTACAEASAEIPSGMSPPSVRMRPAPLSSTTHCPPTAEITAVLAASIDKWN